MKMQINSGMGIYWSSLKNAQIGLDPRIAQCLTEVTQSEMRLIELLLRPHTSEEITLFAIELEIEKNRYQQILSSLTRLGLLEPPQITTLTPSVTPEYQANWRIHQNLPEMRNKVVIEIPRLDSLGTEIALDLAAAGVQKMKLTDSAKVGKFSHPVLRDNYFGMRKNRALANYFRAHCPQIEILPNRDVSLTFSNATQKFPHLAVLTGNNGVDPLAINTFLGSGTPVLVAYIEEIDISIGPLCLPDYGPCGMCLQHHLVSKIPEWPILAPQACAIRNIPTPLASLKLAASFALRAILEYIDNLDFQQNNVLSRKQTDTNICHLPQHTPQLFAKYWKIPPNPAFPYLVSAPVHSNCLCKVRNLNPET